MMDCTIDSKWVVSIATRVYNMVERIRVEQDVVLTGGGAKNIGLVKALEEKLGCRVLIPQEPLLTGALGAAILGQDLAEQALRLGQPLPRRERRLEEATFFT